MGALACLAVAVLFLGFVLLDLKDGNRPSSSHVLIVLLGLALALAQFRSRKKKAGATAEQEELSQ